MRARVKHLVYLLHVNNDVNVFVVICVDFYIMPIIFKIIVLFLRCLFDNSFYVKQLILIIMVRYFVKFYFSDGSHDVCSITFYSKRLAEQYGCNALKNKFSFGYSSLTSFVVGSASIVFDE